MTDTPPRLHTVEGLAEFLNISRTRAYALIGDGQIESVTIGRARRITQGAIDRYIERLESAKTSEAS
jgi:excisionase family DNA binding protein